MRRCSGTGIAALQGSKKTAVCHDGKKEAIMPRGDRTGPMGLGSGTGWGRGLCTGFGAPGFSYGGRGRGRGFGRGFGFRNLWGAPPVLPIDEVSFLKRQISAMEDELSAAKKHLGEIQAEQE
jgi:hypothetical protein